MKKDWKKLIKGIAIGYLIKNYSDSFRKHVEITGVTKHRTSKVIFFAYYFRNGGDGFGIRINLRKKTIDHLGCYSANRNFSNEELINFNINKFENEKA